MQIHLGLGSNLGDRRRRLADGIGALAGAGLREMRVSPVVETPALLPARAPSDWNQPFLNLVLATRFDGSPAELKTLTRRIERDIGGKHGERWAPRALDIDLLLWGDEVRRDEEPLLPHPLMHERSFVLVPLAHLDPLLRIPGHEQHTVLELAHTCTPPAPLWMGIINVTPDSFSDGGLHQQADAIEAQVSRMVEAGAHLVDLGAESTRPGATPLAWQVEWQRLQPALERVLAQLRELPLPPRVSVDTRHAETAERALAAGVSMINDVSGLTDPRMMTLAARGDAEWVAMHHLGIPAANDRRLPRDCDAALEVERWLLERMAAWREAGIDSRRLLFDPGVGFGKNSLQSLQLLQQVERFAAHGLRLLVGHSRKSFMQAFSGTPPRERDIDTVGASLKLADRGVDVLRVHDVAAHSRAWAAWAHVEGYAAGTMPPRPPAPTTGKRR